MNENLNFTDLTVYKSCRKLRKDISILVKNHFPKEEKYMLTSQIVRASRSITANIAEGHGRFYYKENVKFCRNSRGSLEEVLEHLITAYDEAYISKEILQSFKKEHEKCLKLLNGYIRYLKKSKKGKESDS